MQQFIRIVIAIAVGVTILLTFWREPAIFANGPSPKLHEKDQ